MFDALNKIPLEYGSEVQRPNILMIAATHGDEPAGYHALKNFKEDIDIDVSTYGKKQAQAFKLMKKAGWN